MGTAEEEPTTLATQLGACLTWPGHWLAGWTRGNPFTLLCLGLPVCKTGKPAPCPSGLLGD